MFLTQTMLPISAVLKLPQLFLLPLKLWVLHVPLFLPRIISCWYVPLNGKKCVLINGFLSFFFGFLSRVS